MKYSDGSSAKVGDVVMGGGPGNERYLVLGRRAETLPGYS